MTQKSKLNGYSRISILSHWLTVIVLFILLIADPTDNDGLAFVIHVSGGTLIGVFLLWRVGWRIFRGLPTRPKQDNRYNFVANIVIWGFVWSIFVVVMTGYLLPWLEGEPIRAFDFIEIAAPIAPMPNLYGFTILIHNIAGHLIFVLLGFHVLGALKHIFVDKDGVVKRMFKSSGGNA